ncbi:MAG: universal stress protein [Anaerolineales bacterium]|jgi:nucleotide-binding universal stress UspA family protein
MYSKFLVPLDGSKRAERILPHVEELARLMGAKIVFLQVVEPTYEVVGPHGSVMDVTLNPLEKREQEAQNYIDGLVGEFSKLGLSVRGFVERGPVVSTIIHVAERVGADLIALASHGRSGLARVFYGSVAAGILHQVDRPLLIIRSKGEG